MARESLAKYRLRRSHFGLLRSKDNVLQDLRQSREHSMALC